MADDALEPNEEDGRDSIAAVDAEQPDRPLKISAESIEDEPGVTLWIARANDGEEATLFPVGAVVLPWELSAIVDMASGRLTRLPRLCDQPDAAESAPFDFSVGALMRSKPPAIDSKEKIERMNQRQRAIRAMEAGRPAFDLVFKLNVSPDVLNATTHVIGVPGDEVTYTALYWSAHLLRSASGQINEAMANYLRRRGSGHG